MSKRIIVFSLEDGKYAVKGDYNFLEEQIKSGRFEDLILDIKSIDLLDDEDFDI